MYKKIAANFTTTALSALCALLATVGIIANLEAEDYGRFGLAVLLSNSVGLLNIFRPRVLSLIRFGGFGKKQAEEILSAGFVISLLVAIFSFIFVTDGLSLEGSLGMATAVALSFFSAVIADEVDGRGGAVFSATVRNFMWAFFYVNAFLFSYFGNGSVDGMILLLATCLFFLVSALLLKAPSFRSSSFLMIFRVNPFKVLVGNIRMGFVNFCSMLLGTSDRISLSHAAPNTAAFGLYSAVSDLFVRSHVFFRVVSAVVSSEIVAGKLCEKRAIRLTVFTTYGLCFFSLFFVAALRYLLDGLGLDGENVLLVATAFSAAIPLVGCGYLSSAIIQARGDVKSLLIAYAPASVIFAVVSFFVAVYFGHVVLSFLYLASRVSDLVLLSRLGVSKFNIVVLFLFVFCVLLYGFYLYG